MERRVRRRLIWLFLFLSTIGLAIPSLGRRNDELAAVMRLSHGAAVRLETFHGEITSFPFTCSPRAVKESLPGASEVPLDSCMDGGDKVFQAHVPSGKLVFLNIYAQPRPDGSTCVLTVWNENAQWISQIREWLEVHFGI